MDEQRLALPGFRGKQDDTGRIYEHDVSNSVDDADEESLHVQNGGQVVADGYDSVLVIELTPIEEPVHRHLDLHMGKPEGRHSSDGETYYEKVGAIYISCRADGVQDHHHQRIGADDSRHGQGIAKALSGNSVDREQVAAADRVRYGDGKYDKQDRKGYSRLRKKEHPCNEKTHEDPKKDHPGLNPDSG